ncbi:MULTISPECIES: hypothetical protein [Colwellia]|uniref:NIPSNAP domain-containing protein n=1 Tax=Colwellia psychrerythraea (strain 34H / ATCC BAA-681) TaxID=167879 RepID=Q481U3_COLP3|nr:MULTISPECIES: hypothetical protein [Colwellia]AAZ28261.1 hypothetical protein CPS_2459 [Colwellia psychrerythraea 34H]PKH87732.1 hypothetical protein CXF79_13930 [Colwellia sp. Bg11-28]
MKIVNIILLMLLVSLNVVAQDRLEMFKDYDLSKEVLSVTTVKVDPNMEDVYLAGLTKSWIKAVKIQKDLGHIKDWNIWASELPQSGDFNLVLTVTFESSKDLDPNKAKYDKFMKIWGEENQKISQETSAKYPEVRELTGEYRLRKIIFK